MPQGSAGIVTPLEGRAPRERIGGTFGAALTTVAVGGPISGRALP